MTARGRVAGHGSTVIDGWEVARGEPAGWVPVSLPFRGDDDVDWWFRAAVQAEPGEAVVLRLGGVATVSEVFLDGELVASGESMFVPLEAEIGDRLTGASQELRIRCAALAPRLAEPRRPRARWRSKVAYDGNLRWWRTSLLGRAPGFAPGPPVVGPWQDVVLERRTGVVVDALKLRPRLEGDDGVLEVAVALRPAPSTLTATVGGVTAELRPEGGELRVPGVARWWPHTHGEPVLHDVRLVADGVEIDAGRVGFRTLESADPDGLALRVNGVGVFARGAVWTPGPLDALVRMRDAGLNVVRLPGTGSYEPVAFHERCDELGLLVWQDLMFANLDFPFADDGFRAQVDAELDELADVIGGRPSLAVVCGGSEVLQQVAMLGLDPALASDGAAFLGERVAAAGLDAVWVPGAPSGGALPFRVDRGVANYFGVGGYRRPLSDARTSGVRFAAECLAFANVGDHDDPAAGVPRDVGADWDFADVRDHYLRELHGVEPGDLERARLVTGEVMSEAFGEWRRTASVCSGAIVLWLRDWLPGSGWGVLDAAGRPKAAWWHLARALAPVAVWTVDEGLNGVAVHVANDRPRELRARLRVALYRDGELRVGDAHADLVVAGHSAWSGDVEALLGHFADASYAYRFGPPGHDAIVVSLHEEDGALLSQAWRFPVGPPRLVEEADRLGLQGELDGTTLTVRSVRLAYGVRIEAEGFEPSDDAFVIEPGGSRVVELRQLTSEHRPVNVVIRAVNLDGLVRVGP